MTIELDQTGWLLFAGVVLLWGFSFLLAGDRPAKKGLDWRNILLSFFGLAWLGFGTFFIFRFLLLLYDPVYFQKTNFPVWKIPTHQLNQTWIFLGLFWVGGCLGFILMRWCLPPLVPVSLNKKITDLFSLKQVHLFDRFLLFTTCLMVLVNLPGFPKALYTLVGRISALFVVPVAIVWLLHFRGDPIGLRRYVYLIPGAIHYVLLPYRENLIIVAYCVLIPALLTGRLRSFKKCFVGSIVFLVMITLTNSIVRPYLWGGADSLIQESPEESWETWERQPYKSPWVKLANRFHGFDSMALTVYSVPQVFPYSHRQILLELPMRALVPRFIMDTKTERLGGRPFSATIWALSGKGRPSRRESAPIAPSMPGDLYSIDGVVTVFLGASLFGLLVGGLEQWRSNSDESVTCMLIIVFGLPVAGGLERDFVHAFATIIQMLLALFLIFAVLPQRQFILAGGNQKRSFNR